MVRECQVFPVLLSVTTDCVPPGKSVVKTISKSAPVVSMAGVVVAALALPSAEAATRNVNPRGGAGIASVALLVAGLESPPALCAVT